jgi:hypothetical protein
MGIQEVDGHESAPGAKWQDIEFEIGALASCHGISTERARKFVDRCGGDLDCVDHLVHEWKEAH